MEASLVPDTTCTNVAVTAYVAVKPRKRYTKFKFTQDTVIDPDSYIKARYKYFKINAYLTDKRAGIKRRPFASYDEFYAFFVRSAVNLAFTQSIRTNSAMRHWANVAAEYKISRFDKTKAFTADNLIFCKSNKCMQRYDPKSAKKNRNHYVVFEGEIVHIRRVWQRIKADNGFKTYGGFFNSFKSHGYDIKCALDRQEYLVAKNPKATSTQETDSIDTKVAKKYIHYNASFTATRSDISDTDRIVRNATVNV